MRKKKLLIGLAVTAAVGIALAGCSAAGSAGSGASASATDTINLELWYAPATFNPALATATSDLQDARLGFDTLLRAGDDGLVGGLATSWKATSSSEYTFTLREGATCADGTPITPTVVADSFEYLVGLKDAAAVTWKNQAFGSGQPTFTPDDSTGSLGISLSAPYSQLLGGISQPGLGIICPAGLADPTGLAAGTVTGAFSGPYVLADQKPGVSLSYSLRDDYNAWPDWKGIEGVPAKTLNFTVQPDGNTSANLLESGGIDGARFYDSNALRFADEKGFNTVTFASSAYNLVFNQSPGAGSVFEGNQPLRAAVGQAIDPKGFNDAGLDGLGVTQYTVNSAAYTCALKDPSLLQSYDPAAAKAELAGKTIRLLIMSNWDPAADYLAESLRAAGATVEVSAPDPAEWSSKMRTEPQSWDLALAAENAGPGLIHLSIARYLGATYPQGGTNVVGSDNAEGAADLAQAMASVDPDTQCAAFEAAQKTILERVDMMPLITDTHRYVTRPGFAAHVFNGYWDPSAMRITG